MKWIIFIPHLSISCYITVRHFIETYEQLLKLQQKKTVDLVFLDKCIKKLKYPRVISSSINAVDLSTFLQGISNFSFTENAKFDDYDRHCCNLHVHCVHKKIHFCFLA